jgi:hypothetical protein
VTGPLDLAPLIREASDLVRLSVVLMVILSVLGRGTLPGQEYTPRVLEIRVLSC